MAYTMMKNIIIMIFLLIGVSVKLSAQAGFNDLFFDKTMRFDYYHTGTHDTEMISFGALIEEPFYGGSYINLLDTFNYGHYFFEIVSAENNRVVYSRGFSTLFEEWQDTEDAMNKWKTFQGSLVFPFPKTAFLVKIYVRDAMNNWELLYEQRIDTGADYIRKGRPFTFDMFDVVLNGPANEKMDIVFLAEGYTKSEMKKFIKDCKAFAHYLFASAPFKEYKNSINIRGVASISEESGTDFPGKDIWRNTILDTRFYTFGSERYLMTENFHRVRDVASNAPYDQIFIIVNTEEYGGGGIFNHYATGSSDNMHAPFLLTHEFGHAFAGLCDEYYTSEVAVEDHYSLDVEPWCPNLTTLVNFETKWKDMMDETTPIPTPVTKNNRNTLGVYEGGGYMAKGIYRPYIDCTMKSVQYDAFCPVCRRAIKRMILFYAN